MEVLSNNNRLSVNKENKGHSPSKQLQKLKVQLNDRIFQYHRLEEDFAQEKAKLVIDFQKERGHLNKAIKQLKEKNQNDNEEWTCKVDQLRQQKEQALSELARQYENKIQSDKSKLKEEIEIEFKKEISNLKEKLHILQNDLERKQREWKKEKEETIQVISSSFFKKQEEIGRGYRAIIDGLKKDHEEKANQVHYLYIKEEQTRRKLEKELQDKIKDHAKHTVIMEGIANQLTNQNQSLKEEISKLKQSIQEMKSNGLVLNKNHQEQLKCASNHYIQEINRVKNEYEKKSERIAEIHSQHLLQVKAEISSLESIYRQKQKLWDQRGKKLLELYEKRQSKKEDIKAIEQLEVQLIKRDFMLQKERSELKYCRLQMQNMQQIYDKMFLSNNYLAKVKAKSFKVKKLKTVLLNSSNRSMMQNRKPGCEDIK